MSYQIWECTVCGFIYDEGKGLPKEGIAAGTRWQDIPDDWECPDCGVAKSDFDMVAISKIADNTTAIVANTDSVNSNVEQIAHENNAPETPNTINEEIAPIVIIGTGLAGYNLVKEFRKKDTMTPIIMVTADDGSYYAKPQLSVAFSQEKSPEQLVTSTAAEMAKKFNVDIRIFEHVKEINTNTHEIVLKESTLGYQKLVLATGSSCIEAPLQGNGLNYVFNINNLMDFKRYYTALLGKKKVLIIGAGLIGCEYANDMIQSGFEVDVVDPMPTVLSSLLPAEASDVVKSSLAQAGVKFHFGTVVKSINQYGAGVKATLADGKEIEADIVLSAIGVKANTTLAKQANLDVEQAIVVDKSLQTSVLDIYALGDCAQVDGKVLFHIAPLLECSKVLASVLYSEDAEVNYGVMPVMIKTSLCPVMVVPPPKNQAGSWQVKQRGHSVQARFINENNEVIGIALTDDAISEKTHYLKQLT